MKSKARIILNAYNGLLRTFGSKLRVTNADDATGVLERHLLLAAGRESGVNPLELHFNDSQTANCDSEWPDAELFRLKNVWLTGDQGQVFLDDGSLFTPWVWPYDLRVLKIYRPLKLGAKRWTGPPLFHLTGRNHDNRGHFMIEHLPRLMAARDYLKSLPDYRILTAPGHGRWQSRYVDFVGLDPSKVIEGTQGTMQVDELIFVPNMFTGGGLCAPHFYSELSKCAARAPVAEGPGRPLFITRKDAPNKQLLNEDRIVEILRSRVGAVDVISLGKYSMAEQIGMFRDAPLIMGPIGQGLCNVLFTHDSLCVILTPGSVERPVHGTAHSSQLARLCGSSSVTFLSGESLPPHSNWNFPEQHFTELLDQLLARPESSRLKRNV